MQSSSAVATSVRNFSKAQHGQAQQSCSVSVSLAFAGRELSDEERKRSDAERKRVFVDRFSQAKYVDTLVDWLQAS